jgi:hypothetical protein
VYVVWWQACFLRRAQWGGSVPAACQLLQCAYIHNKHGVSAAVVSPCRDNVLMRRLERQAADGFSVLETAQANLVSTGEAPPWRPNSEHLQQPLGWAVAHGRLLTLCMPGKMEINSAEAVWQASRAAH